MDTGAGNVIICIFKIKATSTPSNITYIPQNLNTAVLKLFKNICCVSLSTRLFCSDTAN